MPAVVPGIVEYRVMYVARFAEGIYVLHAFEKRTRQTRRADIEIARRNLAAGLRRRAK
jgi:phage-related protein